MFTKIFRKENSILICLFIIFLIPAVLPLVHKGFFLTDDGEWMIIRFSAFYQTLHDGELPVRFLHRLNFGYGYPAATFLYPGFMYFGTFLHLLKFGFVTTIKLILAISFIGTTCFIYLWLAKVFNKKSAAFMGALMSLYIPYHFYDVYTRGSVGEVFAILWVVFVLWMMEKKNFLFVSLGIFCLLVSHNTLAILFIPMLFIYGFLRKIFLIHKLLLCFLFGFLLSSFFTLPAVFELSLTKFAQTQISNPFSYFADIKLIGVASIVLFIVAFICTLIQKKIVKVQKSVIYFFLIVTFIGIFFSSSLSSFFWHIVPSSFIQFPFRLLSYLIISLAFLIAFIVSQITTKNKKVVIIIVFILLFIFSSLPFLKPKTFFDKGDSYYATNVATTTVQDEYMPNWVKEKPTQGANQKIEIIKGQATVQNLLYNNKRITFTLNVKNNSLIKIYTLYWPGWHAVIDGKEGTIIYNNPQGLIEFAVPSGIHLIKLQFGETPLRIVADSISLLSFVILIFLTKYRKL